MVAENVSDCDLNFSLIKVTFSSGEKKSKGFPREHPENHLPQRPLADTVPVRNTGRSYVSECVPFKEEQFENRKTDCPPMLLVSQITHFPVSEINHL